MKKPFDVDKELTISVGIGPGQTYTMSRSRKPVFDDFGRIVDYELGTFVLEFPASSDIRIE